MQVFPNYFSYLYGMDGAINSVLKEKTIPPHGAFVAPVAGFC